MNAQADLFDIVEAPYQRHSVTSREAAKECAGKAEQDRAQVLAFIKSRGPCGATDDEVQVALNMDGSTQRPRRIELFARRLVRPTGEKRSTRRGKNALVWVAA